MIYKAVGKFIYDSHTDSYDNMADNYEGEHVILYKKVDGHPGYSREQVQEVIQLLSEHLDTFDRDEYYGTSINIFKNFAEEAMRCMFKEQFERDERYKQYLELKKEFENDSN